MRGLWFVLWGFFTFLGGVAWTEDHPGPVFLLDHQDEPWAAWVERRGAVTVGRVSQWTGSAWVAVGPPLAHDADQSVTAISLALAPDGTPWVAWAERPDPIDGKSAGRVYVARWTKTAWEEPALSPSRSGQPGAEAPLVRLDLHGTAWVMWTEVAPGAKVEQIGLASLVDHRWVPLDDPALSDGLHLSPRSKAFALGPNGFPVVVVSRQAPAHGIQLFVSQWDGQHLNALGSGLNVNPEAWAGNPSLVLNTQGEPTVAFVEAADHLKLVVKQWSGEAWHLLGTPGSLGLQSPQGALTPSGSPVVVAVETLVGVTVRQKSNAGWVDLGADISGPQAESPSVAIDSQANPWVFWDERDDQGVRFGLKQWTGTKWKTWPTPEITATPAP